MIIFFIITIEHFRNKQSFKRTLCNETIQYIHFRLNQSFSSKGQNKLKLQKQVSEKL